MYFPPGHKRSISVVKGTVGMAVIELWLGYKRECKGGYKRGYEQGYKQGYMQGYKQGYKQRYRINEN